ncbi:MAG: CPBP family intramembrane metalloprotease [Clostridia bacterium]|nr:CPBP family intramembrane metalloprotease [Clostridia bacterium]
MRNDELQNSTLSPKDGVLAYLVALSVTLVLSFVVFFLPEGNAQTLANYFITQLGFLIVPFLFLKSKGISYLDAVPLKGKVKPLAVVLIIPITIGAFMQNTILSVAFNWLLEALGITPSVNLPSTDGALNVLLAVVAVCLLPALAEEFLFRGIILSSYKNKGLMRACVLSAVVFALSHFNPAQFVHQAILGFILAYITVCSGNVWYGALMHLLNNVIALFIGDVIPAYNNLAILNSQNIIILMIMCAVGAVILIVSLLAFSKVVTRDELKVDGHPLKILSKKGAPAWWNADKVKDPWTIGFIVFMVVMSVLSALTQYLTF